MILIIPAYKEARMFLIILGQDDFVGPFVTHEAAESYCEKLGVGSSRIVEISQPSELCGSVQELLQNVGVGLLLGSSILTSMTKPEDTKPSDSEFIKAAIELSLLAHECLGDDENVLGYS